MHHTTINYSAEPQISTGPFSHFCHIPTVVDSSEIPSKNLREHFSFPNFNLIPQMNLTFQLYVVEPKILSPSR